MQPKTYIDGNHERENAIVVVFLRGGADGLNMVVPVDDDDYYRNRPRIAVPKDTCHRLDTMFALNPKLGPLHEPYLDGELAIVHGAGSEDTTRSHFEAQDYMEHGGLTAGGWLGRYLRQTLRGAAAPLAAVAIGKTQPEVLRGAPSSVAMESLDTFSLGDNATPFLKQLDAVYAQDQSLVGKAGRDMLDAMHRIAALRDSDYVPESGAVYPENDFGNGLQHIAQLIKARLGLRAATIDLDGWDSHFGASSLMDPLMDKLALGLAAFHKDLGQYRTSTTVVVLTEFGRRVYENASFGTDHGRGSIMMVLGGGVRGGRVLSDWAGLREELLEGPGDVPVQHNYRDVLAPLLAKSGSLEDVASVFPGYPLQPLDLYA